MQKTLYTTRNDEYTYLDAYGIPSSGITFITFKVQACSDAYIALSSPIKNKTMIIELGIYNNTLSCIRPYPQDEPSAVTYEAALDCREYRPFTVNWEAGQILVKKGDPTESNTFLRLRLNYNLNDVKVGISTRCESNGIWVFSGMSLFVYQLL